MQGISLRSYSDYKNEPQEDVFYSVSRRGGASAFAVAYPTEDSRSHAACENIVGVVTDSFVRRPSLCDEAMQGISGFANESVYSLQDPEKTFFADCAMLYIFKNRMRCTAFGSAAVYHFNNGILQNVYDGAANRLPGKSLRFSVTCEPDAAIPKGENAFFIFSGRETFRPDTDTLTASLAASGNAEEWILALKLEEKNSRCSVMAVILPEKRLFPFGFKKGKMK